MVGAQHTVQERLASMRGATAVRKTNAASHVPGSYRAVAWPEGTPAASLSAPAPPAAQALFDEISGDGWRGQRAHLQRLRRLLPLR